MANLHLKCAVARGSAAVAVHYSMCKEMTQLGSSVPVPFLFLVVGSCALCKNNSVFRSSWQGMAVSCVIYTDMYKTMLALLDSACSK